MAEPHAARAMERRGAARQPPHHRLHPPARFGGANTISRRRAPPPARESKPKPAYLRGRRLVARRSGRRQLRTGQRPRSIQPQFRDLRFAAAARRCGLARSGPARRRMAWPLQTAKLPPADRGGWGRVTASARVSAGSASRAAGQSATSAQASARVAARRAVRSVRPAAGHCPMAPAPQARARHRRAAGERSTMVRGSAPDFPTAAQPKELLRPPRSSRSPAVTPSATIPARISAPSSKCPRSQTKVMRAAPLNWR